MNSLIAIDSIRLVLILTLAYLAAYDFRTFRLPDAITLPLMAMGLIINGLGNVGFASLDDSIAGAVIGYLLFWSSNYLYRLVKKQNGIGMGDAKLLAALGAWFGWDALPGILLIASTSGLLGGLIWLKFQGQSLRSAFPFGPFLAFAGIIELLWPQTLQILLLSKLV